MSIAASGKAGEKIATHLTSGFYLQKGLVTFLWRPCSQEEIVETGKQNLNTVLCKAAIDLYVGQLSTTLEVPGNQLRKEDGDWG